LDEAALLEKSISLFGKDDIALRGRLISACSSKKGGSVAYFDKRECTGVIASLQLRPPNISIFILDQDFQYRFIGVNPICPRDRIGS
jgi:hypothetical protein